MAATKRPRGLGRGLSTLLGDDVAKDASQPVAASPEKNESGIVELELNVLKAGKYQPRTLIEQEKLSELADSIKQFGILQPLIVQKKKDYYEIIAGERRWRAAKMAGLKEVPVIVKEYDERQRDC